MSNELAADQSTPKSHFRLHQRWLAVRAFALFLVIDVGFRLVGFNRVLGFLMKRAPGHCDWAPSAARTQAQITFQAVQQATRLYYRRRKDCLPKALTTFSMLRRQGIEAELCFGVKKYPFAAHSWVTAFGTVLDDDPPRISAFTIIHRISARGTCEL